MTETEIDMERLLHVFDDAKLVKTDEQLRQISVWKGGITINTYSAHTLEEVTCWTISDENGEALDQEAVGEHIEEIFERDREEMGALA